MRVLGLMSGTSLDGVDFSIIKTDGKEYLSLSGNNYLEFSNTLRQKIREIKSKITNTNECKKVIGSNEYKELSNEITEPLSSLSNGNSQLFKNTNHNVEIEKSIKNLPNLFFKSCSNPKPKIRRTNPSLVPRIINVQTIDLIKFSFSSK